MPPPSSSCRADMAPAPVKGPASRAEDGAVGWGQENGDSNGGVAGQPSSCSGRPWPRGLGSNVELGSHWGTGSKAGPGQPWLQPEGQRMDEAPLSPGVLVIRVHWPGPRPGSPLHRPGFLPSPDDCSSSDPSQRPGPRSSLGHLRGPQGPLSLAHFLLPPCRPCHSLLPLSSSLFLFLLSFIIND